MPGNRKQPVFACVQLAKTVLQWLHKQDRKGNTATCSQALGEGTLQCFDREDRMASCWLWATSIAVVDAPLNMPC